MPSTYTVNLGIEKPATGEQSGTWGDTTNTNFDILDQAINGAVRVTLTSAGTSGSPNQLQITNGAASDGRNKWIEIYSASDLGGSAYLQLDPNDAEKILFIRNSLAGSQSILLFQGTYDAARDLEVPAGVDMVVKFDGGGASAATVTDVYTKLRVTELTTPTLTATTADINGGTLDNSVIGGTTAAAITGTTITANTSLNIAGDGATVTGIKDEDDMSSNSPTKLATQQSIKAYVDSQVGTVDTWAEVLANGATSGSTNPEVTAGQALKTNTINETTAGSGVTIDSVLLKDDVVNATDIEVSSISANDGTEAATLANSTGVMTIASSVLTTTDINGGTIDNTTIGGSTAAVGSFTTLNASSTIKSESTAGGFITLKRDDTTLTNNADVGAINFETTDTDDAGVASTILASGDGTGGGVKLRFYAGKASNKTERLTLYNSGVAVFNEDSNNFDFRVESNNNANMLFVDAGDDAVGIGTNSITGLMELNKTSSGNTLQLLSLVNPVGAASTGAQLWMSGTNATSRGTTIEAVAQSTANDHHLIFSTSAGSSAPSEAMRIDEGQQVGIGTGANVDQMLHVERSSGTTMVKTEVAAGSVVGFEIQKTGSTTANWRLVDGQVANGQFVIYDVTNSRSIFNADSSEIVINDTSADLNLRVESDANANMIFADAGNSQVNINNNVGKSHWGSAALMDLNIAGAKNYPGISSMAYSTTTNAGGMVILGRSASGTAGTLSTTRTGDHHGYLIFEGVNGNGTLMGSAYIAAYQIAGSGANYIAGQLQFFTGTNAAAPTERLLIDNVSTVFNGNGNDVDFRIESDGNANMFFVDAGNNRVGINQGTPTDILHIADSNAVVVKLENTDASLTADQVVGALQFRVNDPSGIGAGDIAQVAVRSDSSVGGSYYMQFNTSSSSSQNYEAMRISNRGQLRIGTTSSLTTDPEKPALQVKGGGGGPHVVYLRNIDVSGGANQIEFQDGSGDNCGEINSNATTNTTTYGTSSDHRLKENVTDITGAIDTVKLLQPRTYNFISDPDDIPQDGFIAHELAAIIPNAVTGEKDAVKEDGSIKPQQVDYGLVTPILTAALQEAITKIETLETQRADLEARLAALESV